MSKASKDRRAYNTEYVRKWRAAHRAAGLCDYCKEPASPNSARNLCAHHEENSGRVRRLNGLCVRCGQAVNPDHGASLCLQCRKEGADGTRLRDSGVTPEMYDEALRHQDSSCAICRKPNGDGKWQALHADHDHVTGKFRGLLCRACNLALGGFGDSVDRLLQAIAYLQIEC